MAGDESGALIERSCAQQKLGVCLKCMFWDDANIAQLMRTGDCRFCGLGTGCRDRWQSNQWGLRWVAPCRELDPLSPIPGCITVNIGDPLQLWSDGLLKSNYHRVRMPYPDEPQVKT